MIRMPKSNASSNRGRPGLKAANTWHATRAIQEAREACGGAGYLAENRLIALKADTDVFTTFEGDNRVLTQLVAEELLTAYADDVKSMSPGAVGALRGELRRRARAMERHCGAGSRSSCGRIVDTREDNEEEGSLFDRGARVGRCSRTTEEYMVASGGPPPTGQVQGDVPVRTH